MANWCSNFVCFSGTKEQIESVDVIFQKMIQKQREEGNGQLPDFIKSDSYFFGIYKSEVGVYTFETKWIPPTEEIIEIAKKVGVKKTFHQYQENGFFIYGKTVLENNTIKEWRLDYDDFDKIEYNDFSETYSFEDEVYDDEGDILDILLERKFEPDSIITIDD